MVACLLGIAGCHGPDAVLLTVTADAPVEQYQLFLHDDDAAQVVYSSGFIQVSAPGQMLDLTKDKLKLALKLSRGGHFTLLLVGVIGEVDDGKPAASATVLFWAGKLHVDGATDVNARLLTVPPGDDADGDYLPDATDFPAHVPEAATLYANHADVLDCNDKNTMPTAADGTPVALSPAQINPFATEICGDGYDENCNGDADEPCVDKDGDGDVRGHDCDDSDPKRHHPTAMDPFPDPPNCCGYSLGKLNTPDEHTDFTGDPVLCPTKRCGDGIDESCRGTDNDPKNDTTCIVDDDCDGYPATVNGQPYDCDDHDPSVHPGAVEPCGSTKDLNCNGTIGEGCVPCDLDGDGYERIDVPNSCPDANDKHPGMVDCNDDDAGVFPGATTPAGGSEGGVSVGKVAAALRGLCRSIYEPKAITGTAKINPFGGMVGDADCNGKPFEGCPALIDPGCDLDGDGWPGVAMSNGKDCNPGNVTLDCDDNDPTTFPSAPVNCKITTGTYKNNCTPQGPADCTGDADGDGYAAPADCDDKDPTVHPFAVEICDGKDNDCDGLVDEGNPDPSGAPLVASGAISKCNDSNTGECAKRLGTCVCSVAQPVVDPSIAGAAHIMCSGEGAAGKATGCFGAGQPKQQSCDPATPKDDDCDGRVDAPDGKNLAVKGMTCGINVGQCKAGVVIGCDMSKMQLLRAVRTHAGVDGVVGLLDGGAGSGDGVPDGRGVQRARRRLPLDRFQVRPDHRAAAQRSRPDPERMSNLCTQRGGAQKQVEHRSCKGQRLKTGDGIVLDETETHQSPPISIRSLPRLGPVLQRVSLPADAPGPGSERIPLGSPVSQIVYGRSHFSVSRGADEPDGRRPWPSDQLYAWFRAGSWADVGDALATHQCHPSNCTAKSTDHRLARGGTTPLPRGESPARDELGQGPSCSVSGFLARGIGRERHHSGPESDRRGTVGGGSLNRSDLELQGRRAKGVASRFLIEIGPSRPRPRGTGARCGHRSRRSAPRAGPARRCARGPCGAARLPGPPRRWRRRRRRSTGRRSSCPSRRPSCWPRPSGSGSGRASRP